MCQFNFQIQPGTLRGLREIFPSLQKHAQAWPVHYFPVTVTNHHKCGGFDNPSLLCLSPVNRGRSLIQFSLDRSHNLSRTAGGSNREPIPLLFLASIGCPHSPLCAPSAIFRVSRGGSVLLTLLSVWFSVSRKGSFLLEAAVRGDPQKTGIYL